MCSTTLLQIATSYSYRVANSLRNFSKIFLSPFEFIKKTKAIFLWCSQLQTVMVDWTITKVSGLTLCVVATVSMLKAGHAPEIYKFKLH